MGRPVECRENGSGMSEPKETTEKTAGASGRKPLSLVSRVESGHVQQKFSHGSSKTVVVEKKRSRSLKEGEEPVAARPLSPAALAPRPQAAKPAASARAEQPKPGALLRTLSDVSALPGQRRSPPPKSAALKKRANAPKKSDWRPSRRPSAQRAMRWPRPKPRRKACLSQSRRHHPLPNRSQWLKLLSRRRPPPPN